MSLPNCGFAWPLAEGFNWILRVNLKERIAAVPSAKEDTSSLRYSIVLENDLWLWQFGAVQRAASHKAVSEEQEFVLFTKQQEAFEITLQ